MSRFPPIGLVLDVAMAQRFARGLFQGLHPSRPTWLLDQERSLAQLRAAIRERKTVGLITRWNPTRTPQLRKLGIPMAVYGGPTTGPNLVSVSLDHAAISAQAAAHLIERGFRTFAYVSNDMPFARARGAAFATAVANAGFAPPAWFKIASGWDHTFEYAPGGDPFVRWLRTLPKPVGLFAAFDRIGWQVCETCRFAGLTVPDDVAIIGVNNDELYCGLSRPPLSSVRVPWEKIGYELALAMERMLAPRRSRRASVAAPVRVAPDGVEVRQSTDLVAVAHPVAAQALRYLRQRASEPITIHDVVRDLSMSRRGLEYVFRHHVHRSPRAELTRLRIERAKALLLGSDLPMALVAERCGFNYAERFSLAFKRATGTTPMAFRRRHADASGTRAGAQTQQ